MILGKEAKKNKEFKMHLLTCEYREMHAMMKQEKANYEKSLREGSALNITNPYKKEYGYVTVNPHNFTFISQPEPCRGNDTILVTVHSATQVNTLQYIILWYYIHGMLCYVRCHFIYCLKLSIPPL